MIKKAGMVQVNYTLADVARELGISSTAVSMALRNTGGVSDELQKKVLEKAQEMNYAPALAARVLRGKYTGQLGLNLSQADVRTLEESEGFYLPLITHFVHQCEAIRYSYHIELSGKEETFKAPSQLVGRLVDGILLAGKPDGRLLEWLAINPTYKWVSVMEPAEHCVLSANSSGIYRAVEHLAALGHRDIALVHCDIEFDVHAAARKGYCQAVKDFNLNAAPHLCQELRSTPKREFLVNIQEWCDYIMREEHRPTAIICNDIKMAHALIIKAAALGLKIPEDLSIIAYGTRAGAERLLPFISTVEADFAAIMEKSINLLIRLIRDTPIPEKQLTVEPKLVIRDTVMPPSTKH